MSNAERDPLGDSIPWVRRPTGRTIPDLTNREHVCEWQRGRMAQAAPVSVREVSKPLYVAPVAPQAPAKARTEGLSMMIRMLAYAFKRIDPRKPPSTLPDRAMALLKSHGLQGSVLRDADDVPKDSAQPGGLWVDAFGQPRTRYVRVSLNRSHCVMGPSEGDCYVEEARDGGDPDWERYIVTDVYLSRREFEDLPDHDGF